MVNKGPDTPGQVTMGIEQCDRQHRAPPLWQAEPEVVRVRREPLERGFYPDAAMIALAARELFEE